MKSKLKDLDELKKDIEVLQEQYSYLCERDYTIEDLLKDTIYEIEQAIEDEKNYPDEEYYTKEDYELEQADDDWSDRMGE